jgi:glycosyltransferase involved in cell wall biosynthesis
MRKHIVIDGRNRRSSTGRYTDRLVEHLQDVDDYNNYTVLVQPDDNWQMHSPNFRTLPSPFPQFSFNPLSELRFSLQLYRLRPDLVHFTMTQQPLLYFGHIITTTHDLTMFHFVRRGSTPRPVFWAKMRLYHFLMWWSHKKSARIIVPTHTVAKELAQFQPFTKKKLAVTYEAVGAPIDGPAHQPKVVNGEFIMHLGNAFPHKNLERLVHTFNILYKTRPELKLVLVGKADKHTDDLKRAIAHLPCAGSVIVTGFLPDSEAKWLYKHCRAYVLPSLMEGWGLTALEAMSNGAPVLASNTSVMPEVYGEAAHYFNGLDPQDMATKIAEVLDNTKLREQLIKNGAAQIKKYSWARMAEETLTVYESVIG